MNHGTPSSCSEPAEATKKTPVVTSLQDLTIIEAWDTENNTSKYITFYLVTPDEEVYFGQSPKNKRDMTLAEYTASLERVNDEEIYPLCPPGTNLTIAPATLDDTSAYIKRPGLTCYEDVKGTDFITKALRDETLIMEQISQPTPHPHIIKYHGCRVRRGRITAIVLERLDSTLQEYVSTPGFQTLDKARFIAALESAVDHLHALGLTHNDINLLRRRRGMMCLRWGRSGGGLRSRSEEWLGGCAGGWRWAHCSFVSVLVRPFSCLTHPDSSPSGYDVHHVAKCRSSGRSPLPCSHGVTGRCNEGNGRQVATTARLEANMRIGPVA